MKIQGCANPPQSVGLLFIHKLLKGIILNSYLKG